MMARFCKRCGRSLKKTSSVINGMGPVCARKGIQYETGDLLSMLNNDFYKEGLVCRRENGDVQTNIPHRKVYHSPTGFEWGYAGSGPAELALNTLLMLIGEDLAFDLHQDFKRDFIAGMPKDGGTVPIETIKAWLAAKGIEP